MRLLYDWVSLLLWSLEIVLLSLALLFVFFSIRAISRDSVLHYMFRVLMIILVLRTHLQVISRCIIIYHRAFICGPRNIELKLQDGINAGK
ncbi:hypothetical protein PENTCL1PPCAC_6702 [Pristionchus entomophagus]|uniref:G protein-coupled receptor n=1 Tax=Pristionchus entomophagus TaxID=358040 RepID=A0AAV5SPT7_9BILA|nr:hypothetical protein PENTCL1PPCAC_6702 [Pristionchus entomophagus]